MSEVSDWETIDKENTAIDGLTLSAPQGNYWQKMMGAIKRMFGTVDGRVTALEQGVGDPADLTTENKQNVVAAINELEERFDHHEPKLRYDPTPIYTVSLAEERPLTDGNPYVITKTQLGGEFAGIFVFISGPITTSATSCGFYAYLDNGESIRGVAYFSAASGDACNTSFEIIPCDGIYKYRMCRTDTTGMQSVPLYSKPTASNFIESDNRYIDRIEFFSDTVILPAGATITIYGAREV